MLASSFRPHLNLSHPWKARRPSTPEVEVEPTDELGKKPSDSDQDTETESAVSSDKDTTAPTLPPTAPTGATSSNGNGVASSFARAGKRLWGSNPLAAALKKQHSRTVSDFSESDFTTPFTPGTPVWTRYGLGSIVTTRTDDGFLVINLQGISRMTLYLNPSDEDYYSVPAIRHDWVDTPAGEGRVISFDHKMQTYLVRLGSDSGRADVEVNVHRSDLRRIMPVRRQAHSINHPNYIHHHANGTTPPQAQESSGITKGLNNALMTIVNTSSGISTSTYHFVSNYYYHGQCVETTFGAGTIVQLDQNNHRAQVQLVWGAMAFLSTDAILYYVKALVGMEVTTKFGPGIVTEVRPADCIYRVKLHTMKDGEPEVVFVHESDVVRVPARRLRLESAQKQITEKLASTTKLFSFAQNKVKLFGHTKTTTSTPPVGGSPKAVRTPAAASSGTAPWSRSKSIRDPEQNDEVSSAGI